MMDYEMMLLRVLLHCIDTHWPGTRADIELNQALVYCSSSTTSALLIHHRLSQTTPLLAVSPSSVLTQPPKLRPPPHPPCEGIEQDQQRDRHAHGHRAQETCVQ